MAHTKDPNTFDKSMAPPPCKIEGTAEHQAIQQAGGFLTTWYQCMDAGPQARGGLPVRPDTIGCFQKGASDRFVGQAISQAVQRSHQGQQRDLSGLSVHIFGGSHMLCLVCGDMLTAASAAQQTKFRFADFFLISSDAQGPHVKNFVMREIDEDMGPPPPGAQNPQDPKFAQCDALGQQFLPAFYRMLDDPAGRQGIAQFVRDQTVLTVGNDMFKGSVHIAHKLHYFPPLISAQARKVEGIEAMPSPANGVFLFVHGELQMSGEVHTQRFIDVFHLMPEGQNWWITNLIFKFHGGGSQ